MFCQDRLDLTLKIDLRLVSRSGGQPNDNKPSCSDPNDNEPSTSKPSRSKPSRSNDEMRKDVWQ